MPESADNPANGSATALSPYDTGERCEAKPWVPYGTKVSGVTPADNFGRVDFEDDGGDTVAVAYIERDADGGHTLHVASSCAPGELRINLTEE